VAAAPKRAIALGVFDGLHVAHTQVIRAAKAFAGMEPSVLLFNKHPQQYLNGAAPKALMTKTTRNALLTAEGYTLLHMPFPKIAELSPEAFVQEILLKKFHAGAVTCGYHYRFGKDAAGDTTRLELLCEENGLACTVISKITYLDQPVSSSRIREALSEGRMEDAAAMLGNPFSFILPVLHGDEIGRTMGSPTINQQFPRDFVVPRHGTYVSETLIGDTWNRSVTNIGRRPSFEANKLRCETHILDFDGDLYDRHIPVRLLQFLRDEVRLPNLESLSVQIQQDVSAARAYVPSAGAKKEILYTHA
jgi:riboflavin kinase/FMN adenylyltransferase